MGRTLGVGVVLLLALGLLNSPAFAQGDSGRQDRSGGLKQNYPNPLNPVTNIPFTLEEDAFQTGNPVVTIRILNVLRQFVAIPTAVNHPAGNNTPIERLEYMTLGDHVAFWDGLDKDGRKVASGIYIVQLEVNGRPYRRPMKMTVAK
jgi:hypothetical protein